MTYDTIYKQTMSGEIITFPQVPLNLEYNTCINQFKNFTSTDPWRHYPWLYIKFKNLKFLEELLQRVALVYLIVYAEDSRSV